MKNVHFRYTVADFTKLAKKKLKVKGIKRKIKKSHNSVYFCYWQYLKHIKQNKENDKEAHKKCV